MLSTKYVTVRELTKIKAGIFTGEFDIKMRSDFDSMRWVLLAKKSGSFDITKKYLLISFV